MTKTASRKELVKLLEQFHGELMIRYCWGAEGGRISERWIVNRLLRIEKRLPHLAGAGRPYNRGKNDDK